MTVSRGIPVAVLADGNPEMSLNPPPDLQNGVREGAVLKEVCLGNVAEQIADDGTGPNSGQPRCPLLFHEGSRLCKQRLVVSSHTCEVEQGRAFNAPRGIRVSGVESKPPMADRSGRLLSPPRHNAHIDQRATDVKCEAMSFLKSCVGFLESMQAEQSHAVVLKIGRHIRLLPGENVGTAGSGFPVAHLPKT